MFRPQGSSSVTNQCEDPRSRNVLHYYLFQLLHDRSTSAPPPYLCRSNEPLPNYIITRCEADVFLVCLLPGRLRPAGSWTTSKWPAVPRASRTKRMTEIPSYSTLYLSLTPCDTVPSPLFLETLSPSPCNTVPSPIPLRHCPLPLTPATLSPPLPLRHCPLPSPCDTFPSPSPATLSPPPSSLRHYLLPPATLTPPPSPCDTVPSPFSL